jgi:hypothetical protein
MAGDAMLVKTATNADPSVKRTAAPAPSGIVLRKRWEFRLEAHDGRLVWTWSVSADNGPTISCTERFESLAVCIKDAATAGYTGEAYVMPRASIVRHIAGD